MQKLSQTLKDTTSIEKENSVFKTEVLGTAICKCGAEFDSHVRNTMFGRVTEVTKTMCIVCQMKEDDRKLLEEQKKKWNREAMDRFISDSLLNPKLKVASFDTFEPTNEQITKAKAICERYANNFDLKNPVNLLLIGNYGTGKSHLAVSIAKRVIEQKAYKSLFMPTPKLLTKLRSTYNRRSDETEEEIIGRLSRVSLLIMDDIGSEQSKPTNEFNEQTWATSKIFEIVDNRIGKHTIFTTNFSVEELQERVGGRNFSRMMENTHVVKMFGEDYRLRNFK